MNDYKHFKRMREGFASTTTLCKLYVNAHDYHELQH